MIDSRQAWQLLKKFKKSNPVRKENTGERDLAFSKWMREECRASLRGCRLGGDELGAFVVFDLDFIIYDYHRKIMQLLEVKTHNGRLSKSQADVFSRLDVAISAGASAAGFTYLGWHNLILNNRTPYDSTVILWNNESITREECWRKINMIDSI